MVTASGERAVVVQAALHSKRSQQSSRLSEWQAGHKVGYAEGWHDAMAEVNRQHWASRGISSENVDRYLLGYCARRTFEGKDKQLFASDCYTIPHYAPASWQLVNMQYRINQLPANAGGKYRQEPGLPPASFFALPGVLSGQALLMEGAVKAIVLSQLVDRKLQCIGWPGAMPGEELYQQLEGFETLWLMLDPGKGWSKAVSRAVELLGQRVMVVSLPEKPDDLVVSYGLDLPGLKDYMRQARPA